jgi:hypothetical protein
MFEVVEEFPIFALILHFEATPMHMGSRAWWLILAGIIKRPRATSLRINSEERFSRRAINAISPVIIPFLA